MRSVPRLHKESTVCCDFGIWKPVQLGGCSETGDSQRRREAVNTEVEGFMALEAVTRQRLVKTQHTEKALVNCRACELAVTI
jgi:hypothetical protein